METILEKILECSNSKEFNTLLTHEEKALIKDQTQFLQPLPSKIRDLNYRIAHVILKKNEACLCKYCEQPLPFRDFKSFLKQVYCSASCKYKDNDFYAGARIAQNRRKVEIHEKRTQTVLSRYGVPNAMQCTQVNDLRRQQYNQLSADVIDERVYKRQQTNIERYGVSNPLQQPHIRLKKIQNSRDRKCVSQVSRHITLDDDYRGILDERGNTIKYQFVCNKCDTRFYFHFGSWNKQITCPKCSDRLNTYEDFIERFLKLLKIQYIKNDRNILNKKELDFYLPDLKIAIEINGLYYHSSKFITDKNYHINKTTQCADMGIRLIHIFGDEIIRSPKAVLTRLRSIVKCNSIRIFARKCTIKFIDNATSNTFLSKYHLQGNAIGAKELFGIFYKGRLLQVATFGLSRLSLGTKNNNEWELYRLASMHNVTVVGGFSKLLKKFTDQHPECKLKTYLDRRWAALENSYQTNFVLSHTSKPNYWIVVGNKRFHRFGFSKSHLKNKLDGFDEEASESQNLAANNILKIWDCGNFCYHLR